jgi:hypothetical protein
LPVRQIGLAAIRNKKQITECFHRLALLSLAQ